MSGGLNLLIYKDKVASSSPVRSASYSLGISCLRKCPSDGIVVAGPQIRRALPAG